MKIYTDKEVKEGLERIEKSILESYNMMRYQIEVYREKHNLAEDKELDAIIFGNVMTMAYGDCVPQFYESAQRQEDYMLETELADMN